jgi:hypothetical protein
MDHTHALPDDALADILGRLSARDLAASRRVRKAWLAVVDARQLLLPHVLQLSVRGLFINYFGYKGPRLFARPSAEPAVDGDLSFLPPYHRGYITIVDHCRGLLLLELLSKLCVVNPATRRWEDFPWVGGYKSYDKPHLVFDPLASPHYEVFLIPQVPCRVALRPPPPKKLPKKVPKKGDWKSTTPKRRDKCGEFSGPYGLINLFSLPTDEPTGEDIEEEDDFEYEFVESSSSEPYKQKSDVSTCSESQPTERKDQEEDPHDLEWPPSLWTLNVFSSSTKQWHMRSFLRQGEVTGTMTIVQPDSPEEHVYTGWRSWGRRWRYSEYWQGSLYVHCNEAFVVRYIFIFAKSLFFSSNYCTISSM